MLVPPIPIPSPSAPTPFFLLPFSFPSSYFFRARVWSHAAKASAIGALSPTLFSSQAPGVHFACHYRDTAKVPISRLAPRAPARPVLENAHPFLPVSHPRSRSRTRAPPDVPRLQRYLPDRVSRLVLNGANMCFAESSLSIKFIRRVAKFPNPDAPGVPGRNWILDAVAYIVSWVLWLFGVFLGHEVLYSYYRRWCFRE